METIITVVGEEGLRRKLAQIAAATRGEIGIKAARAGAELIRDQAATNAPKRSGRLARSITILELEPRGDLVFHLVVETSEGFFQGDEFYAGFQEMGWRAGKRGRRSLQWVRDHRGNLVRRRRPPKTDRRPKVPGKHFIRRAFRTQGPRAAETITRELWKGIAAEASRGSR